MAKKRKLPTTAKFKVGDQVRVKLGIRDPHQSTFTQG